MARCRQILLEEDRAVAERRLGFAPRPGYRLGTEVVSCLDDPHTLAAPTRRGFDEERKADFAAGRRDQAVTIKSIGDRRSTGKVGTPAWVIMALALRACRPSPKSRRVTDRPTRCRRR